MKKFIFITLIVLMFAVPVTASPKAFVILSGVETTSLGTSLNFGFCCFDTITGLSACLSYGGLPLDVMNSSEWKSTVVNEVIRECAEPGRNFVGMTPSDIFISSFERGGQKGSLEIVKNLNERRNEHGRNN